MSLKTALAWYWVLTFGIPSALMGCVLVVALVVTNCRAAWRVVTHQPIIAPPPRPASAMPISDIRSVLAIVAGIGVLGLMIWTIPQMLQVLLICRRFLIGQ